MSQKQCIYIYRGYNTDPFVQCNLNFGARGRPPVSTWSSLALPNNVKVKNVLAQTETRQPINAKVIYLY